jgi:ParB family transcriptional regulator, chromosome partitioning protein
LDNFKEIPIESVVVGQRFRKECGNIQQLATSISKIGLLHPIIVQEKENGSYSLLAGFRRLQAQKSLESKTICAHILGEIQDD